MKAQVGVFACLTSGEIVLGEMVVLAGWWWGGGVKRCLWMASTTSSHIKQWRSPMMPMIQPTAKLTKLMTSMI